jgi:hypothetical protein
MFGKPLQRLAIIVRPSITVLKCGVNEILKVNRYLGLPPLCVLRDSVV